MRLSHLITAIEEYAPLSLQESWDNSGLQVALPPQAQGECTGALLCLDVTPPVIDEAVSRGCNLVISHHPLIFKGLKHLTGRTPAECTAAAAIRAGVAVYSSHTALDSTRGGVSYEMARRLGAEPLRVLAPADTAEMLVRATCPRAMADDVRLILLGGDSATCDSFDVQGQKTNSPDAPGFPAEILLHEPLCRVEARVAASALAGVTSAIRELPYSDRVRLDVIPVEERDSSRGLGIVARFAEPVSMEALASMLKERFGSPAIKASRSYQPGARVSKIALCGGSGGEFIGAATASGAQAYVSADIRYHDFADNAANPMTIFDIGHFESESCAKDIFFNVIKNKFPNFAVYFSDTETIPVKYL